MTARRTVASYATTGADHDRDQRAGAVQQQMWVVDRMDPAAAIYNEDIAFWIDGDLRPEVLRSAWRTLTERHEVLRYVFRPRSGELWLRVLPDVDVAFSTVSVTSEDAALAWGTDLVQAPYGDIADRPPVRFGLAHVGDDRHLLVIGFHHGIIDVGSIALLFEELGELYAAGWSGRPAVLTPVGRTYADLVAETDTPQHRERVEGLRREVVARLTADGGPRSAEVPSDRPRGAVKSTHGRLAEARFPAGIVPRLRACAAAHRVTPFQVLLAGMTTLLRRWTGQDDMVVGVGTGGRPDGFEDAIGPFACFVPVRMGARPTSTFADLLVAARLTTLDLAEAQFVPFSQVVNEVVATRDPSRSPLVQIVFNAPPLAFRSDVLTGCVLGAARLPRTRSRVDMLVNLEWAGDDVVATAEFDDSLYDLDTVTTFLGQLGVLVDQAARRPDLPVDQLDLPWPGAPITVRPTPDVPADRDDRVGTDDAWCVLGDDGCVTAVSAGASVREADGRDAPVGVAGDLWVADRPVPGVRVRRTADGRLRLLPTDGRSGAPAVDPDGRRGDRRVEQHVVDLCRELLENPDADPGDDFFVAGGHSMLAARLVQRLGDEFGVDVPLLMVFEHPLLVDMAAELDAQFPEVAQVLERLERLSDTEVADLWEQLPPDDGDPGDPTSVVTLSGHEQPFWLMEQFAPGSSVNTLTLRVRGSGRLDVAALEYALDRTVDREEILRTGYGSDRTMNAVRHVHDHVAGSRIRVHHTDAAGADRLAEQESTTGFDITAAPLVRCAVVFTGVEDFEILLSCHHLVMDYWGVTRVMLRAMSAYYRERTSGVPAVLDPPEGYRRAILRDTAWRDSPQARAEVEYWREQLHGMRPATFRPERRRPDTVDFRGAVATATADPGLVALVDVYLTEHRTTLFAVVAAAVAATARSWSHSDDISFMSPAENRRHDTDARVMGTFVNLVTLRYRFDADLTWDGLLARSRRVTLDAYANQSVPINVAMANAGQQNVVASGQGHYLVLNVFADRTGLELDGCHVDGGVIVQHDSASTDLELSVMSSTGGIGLTMKYRTSLWDAPAVERILRDVLGALRSVVTEGTGPLPALDAAG